MPSRVLVKIVAGSIVPVGDNWWCVDVDRVAAAVRLLHDVPEEFLGFLCVHAKEPKHGFSLRLAELLGPDERLHYQHCSNPKDEDKKLFRRQYAAVKSSFHSGEIILSSGEYIPVDRRLAPTQLNRPSYLESFADVNIPGWAEVSVHGLRVFQKSLSTAAVKQVEGLGENRSDHQNAIRMALSSLENFVAPDSLLDRHATRDTSEGIWHEDIQRIVTELAGALGINKKDASRYCWTMWRRIHAPRLAEARTLTKHGHIPRKELPWAVVNRVFGASRAVRGKIGRCGFALDEANLSFIELT